MTRKCKVLAEILQCCEKTAYNKLVGKTEFTLRELKILKNHYNHMSYDELIKCLEITTSIRKKER